MNFLNNMATGLPFVDLATSVRDAIFGPSNDEVNGEKANDYEPVGPGDPRYDEIVAEVTTQAASQINQSLINQALAEKRAKQTKTLMWLLGGGLAAFVLLGSSGGGSRKRRRR